jgi:hypothetical protein
VKEPTKPEDRLEMLRVAMARSLSAVEGKTEKDKIDKKEDAAVEKRRNAETQ